MPVDTGQGSFLYFSTLLGGPVRDASTGRNLGRLREIAARTSGTAYPRASRLFLRRGLLGAWASAPWSAVRDAGPRGLRVDAAAVSPCPGRPEAGPEEILIECDVLDQQVVDTDGAKVVRVNDVHLFRHGTELYLAHVDIGARGLLRRLGYERLVVGGVRLLTDYRMKERLVAWKHLHLLPSAVEDPHRATSVRLDVSQGRLNDLHPADMADLLEDLDARTRDKVFESLPHAAAAEALAEARPDVAHGILDAVGAEKAADLLEAMDPGEAVEVFRDLPHAEAEALLGAMEPGKAENLRALLTHPEETAGGLMTTRYLAADPSWTALRAIQEVRRHAGEMEVFTYLYALGPEGILLGVVSLKELFQAPPRVPVRRLLVAKPITLPQDAPRAEVERAFTKYGLRAIPVVDAEGRMQGVVRFKRVLEGMERRP